MGAAREEVFDELMTAMRKQDDDAIWDYTDVADYLKVARETVKKLKVTDSTFPKSVHYARGRFRAGEIKQWALRSSRA